MQLDAVWSLLSEQDWESAGRLRMLANVDEETLTRLVSFLVRYDFAETREVPDLQVRRKHGAISPVAAVSLLRAVSNETPTRLAERVACRVCGERTLNHLGGNMVECNRCHERQWYTIERQQEERSFRALDVEDERPPLKRLLTKMGFPQRAFVRHIPKTTRYYWFQCSTCKKISTDYPHGHSGTFHCQRCKTGVSKARMV